MSKGTPRTDAHNIRATGAKQDLNALVGRSENYERSIDSGVALGKYSEKERNSVVQAGLLSTIEGLGSKELYTHLTDGQIQKLTNTLNKTSQQTFQDANDTDKKKYKLNMAKTEASLKGFVFPTDIGGPSGELDLKSISTEELVKLQTMTKEALVSLNDKQIPATEYSKTAIKKITEMAAQDPTLKNKLSDVGAVLEQGIVDKERRKGKFHASDLEELSQVAAKVAGDLEQKSIQISNKTPQKSLTNEQTITQNTIQNSLPNQKVEQGQISPLSPQEKKDISASIVNKVQLNATGMELAKSTGSELTYFKVAIDSSLSRFKDTTVDSPFPTIDKKLLTDNNLKEFQKDLNAATEAVIPTVELSKKLHDKGTKLNDVQNKEMHEKFTKLAKDLGPEYFKEHRQEITDEFAKTVKEKKSIGTRIFGRFKKDKETAIDPKSVDKAMNKVLEQHKEKAQQYNKGLETKKAAPPQKSNTELSKEREARAQAAKNKTRVKITKKAIVQRTTPAASQKPTTPKMDPAVARANLKKAAADYAKELERIKKDAPPKLKTAGETRLADKLQANMQKQQQARLAERKAMRIETNTAKAGPSGPPSTAPKPPELPKRPVRPSGKGRKDQNLDAALQMRKARRMMKKGLSLKQAADQLGGTPPPLPKRPPQGQVVNSTPSRPPATPKVPPRPGAKQGQGKGGQSL